MYAHKSLNGPPFGTPPEFPRVNRAPKVAQPPPAGNRTPPGTAVPQDEEPDPPYNSSPETPLPRNVKCVGVTPGSPGNLERRLRQASQRACAELGIGVGAIGGLVGGLIGGKVGAVCGTAIGGVVGVEGNFLYQQGINVWADAGRTYCDDMGKWCKRQISDRPRNPHVHDPWQ